MGSQRRNKGKAFQAEGTAYVQPLWLEKWVPTWPKKWPVWLET